MFPVLSSILAIGRQKRQNGDDMTRPVTDGQTVTHPLRTRVAGPLALEWRASLATRWMADSASDSRWNLCLESEKVGGGVAAPPAPRTEPQTAPRPGARTHTLYAICHMPSTMIARLWRGQTSAAKAEEYLEYLRVTGVRDYTKTPGNRGVRILRRIAGDKAEFLVLSVWDSLEAIQGFAGSDYQKAVYYPKDRKYLTRLDPEVEHFDLVLDTTTPDT